jgi:hypothetical protein
MAYVTYASIASAVKHPSGEVERSRWGDQVSEAANHHSRSINDMRKGEYYETLKDDPRRSKKADEKVSLASAPYHIEALQKTKTSLPDEETRTLPMNKGATKFVNKFVEKAKKLHEEHEKQNAEAA